MGIINFTKEAGGRIGDALTDNWLTDLVGISDDNEAEAAAKARAEAAQRVDTSHVQARREGETIILTGNARSQADAEKMIVAAGNHGGIAAVDNRLEVEQKAPESRFYEVKAGDTLSGIAKAMYGDAGKYNAIFEANRPMLADPDKIYPGQTLRIPAQ